MRSQFLRDRQNEKEVIIEFLQHIFDCVWTTYCDAVQEQVSIIVSVLVALLTGGFLMLFVENQHLDSKVTENYHAIMDPFMHRFSGYVRFIESIKTYYVIKPETGKGACVWEFKNLLDVLGKEGSKSILSGRDIPIGHYSPEEFTNVCETMNSVWYCWEENRSYMMNDFTFDSDCAMKFNTFINQYLNEAMPNFYNNKKLTDSLVAEVSDKMYCNLYQPIKDYPYQYRLWQEKEKMFNCLTVTIILVNLGILALILLCRYFLPIWIFTLLTIGSISLLGYAIINLMKLIDLSKRLFR